MIRIFLFTSILLFASYTTNAQVKLGIKGGFNTTQINPEKIDFTDPITFQDFSLEVKDARYGIHFGALLKIYIEKFYLQPEIILNSNTTSYTFQTLGVNRVLEENYQSLDFPLMLGFDLGVLNLFGGPVGHVHLSSASEMGGLAEYDPKWSDVNWGWQAGIGFDIWKLNLDLRYEGNFSNYGDHIRFFGKSYDFSDKPSRIITSIAFIF
jgi:hypothetical protein